MRDICVHEYHSAYDKIENELHGKFRYEEYIEMNKFVKIALLLTDNAET